MAHVGVLKVLAEQGLSPVQIGGASIGSLIGAIYAVYGLEGMFKLLLDEQCQERYFQIALRSDELMRSEVAYTITERLLGDATFADCRTPLTIVVTDLETGEPVFLDSGPLLPAVMASIALPGLFRPVEIDGRRYSDGGFSHDMPVAELRRRGADVVIGVPIFWNRALTRHFYPAGSQVGRVAPWLRKGLHALGSGIWDLAVRQLPARSTLPAVVAARMLSRGLLQITDPDFLEDCDVVICPRYRTLLASCMDSDYASHLERVAAGELATLRAVPAIRTALDRKRVASLLRPAIHAVEPGFAPVAQAIA